MTVPQCEGNRGEGELKHLFEVEGDQTISMQKLNGTESQRTPKWGAIEILDTQVGLGVRGPWVLLENSWTIVSVAYTLCLNH